MSQSVTTKLFILEQGERHVQIVSVSGQVVYTTLEQLLLWAKVRSAIEGEGAQLLEQLLLRLEGHGADDALIIVDQVTIEALELLVKQLHPPKFAQYLLYLFIKKHERDGLLGDLRQEYIEVLANFGQTGARVWFYKQVFSSLRPLIRRGIIKWTAVASVVKLLRRIVFT
jgi:hypothetical protein